MKARLRICNGTDTSTLFTAKLCGGVRGFEDINALEAFSNTLSPCLKTIMNFTFVVEPMNTRMDKMLEGGLIPPSDGTWIDLRSMMTRDGVSGTITTTVDHNVNYVTEDAADHFRVRKITEREAFRLMGVDDADIDKIQAAGISKSQQYKLAGNSIVVDVLCAIFRKMFIDVEDESVQGSLF